MDVIEELPTGVVLIERRHEPLGWAIPGGLVDEGEPIEAAAVRELSEELNLDVVLSDLLYVYSDPRHHTLTTVFIGRPTQDGDVPRTGDDAKALQVVCAEAPPTLAFDHAMVLADYVHLR